MYALAAGTNFLIRSKAFQECGWSPEYTLTEDFALGMELKMRHWQVLIIHLLLCQNAAK